jgi:hypothetical protein
MNEFARVTKHRPQLLQTKDDVDQLRRKMIATQVPQSVAVFPFVSDDLAAIEFRAPGAMSRFKTDIRPYCATDKDYTFLMDPRNKPSDVGEFIASMQWPHLDEIVDLSDSGGGSNSSSLSATPPPRSGGGEWTPISDPIQIDFSSDPSIAEFKLQAGISHRFPAELVAEQIFLTHMGAPIGSELLSKHQTFVPAIPLNASIARIVDTFPRDKIEALCKQLNIYSSDTTAQDEIKRLVLNSSPH